jgi:hypothetical protein
VADRDVLGLEYTIWRRKATWKVFAQVWMRATLTRKTNTASRCCIWQPTEVCLFLQSQLLDQYSQATSKSSATSSSRAPTHQYTYVVLRQSDRTDRTCSCRTMMD